jgi:hypothetical protein
LRALYNPFLRKQSKSTVIFYLFERHTVVAALHGILLVIQRFYWFNKQHLFCTVYFSTVLQFLPNECHIFRFFKMKKVTHFTGTKSTECLQGSLLLPVHFLFWWLVLLCFSQQTGLWPLWKYKKIQYESWCLEPESMPIFLFWNDFVVLNLWHSLSQLCTNMIFLDS